MRACGDGLLPAPSAKVRLRQNLDMLELPFARQFFLQMWSRRGLIKDLLEGCGETNTALSMCSKAELYARVYSYNITRLFRSVDRQRRIISKMSSVVAGFAKAQQPRLMPDSRLVIEYFKSALQPGMVFSLPSDVFGHGLPSEQAWREVELQPGLSHELVLLGEQWCHAGRTLDALEGASSRRLDIQASIFFRIVNNYPERRTLTTTGVDEERYGKISVVTSQALFDASASDSAFGAWSMHPTSLDVRRLLSSVDLPTFVGSLYSWTSTSEPMLAMQSSLPGALVDSTSDERVENAFAKVLAIFHAHGAVCSETPLVWDLVTESLLDSGGRCVGSLPKAMCSALVSRRALLEDVTQFGDSELSLNTDFVKWDGRPVFSECRLTVTEPIADLLSLHKRSKLGVVMQLALGGWVGVGEKCLAPFVQGEAKH